jgi:hypothetical protein
MLHYILAMVQRSSLVSGESVPALLTVEEAGTLLRIGRTKAYAMAREWRETEGRSGLPVIDLGHVLRVPRRALEELVGADFSEVAFEDRDRAVGPPDEKPKASPPSHESGGRDLGSSRNDAADQLDLFDSRARES